MTGKKYLVKLSEFLIEFYLFKQITNILMDKLPWWSLIYTQSRSSGFDRVRVGYVHYMYKKLPIFQPHYI